MNPYQQNMTHDPLFIHRWKYQCTREFTYYCVLKSVKMFVIENLFKNMVPQVHMKTNNMLYTQIHTQYLTN